jgi:MFS superfamily sulfate permease-like transporter
MTTYNHNNNEFFGTSNFFIVKSIRNILNKASFYFKNKKKYVIIYKINLKKQMEQQKNTYITRIFPFLLWYEKLKNPKIFKKDIISGVTVALVLIPQSMAYA